MKFKKIQNQTNSLIKPTGIATMLALALTVILVIRTPVNAQVPDPDPAKLEQIEQIEPEDVSVQVPITYNSELVNNEPFNVGTGIQGSTSFRNYNNSALYEYYNFCAEAGDLLTIEVHRTTNEMDPAMHICQGIVTDSTQVGSFNCGVLPFVASADDNNGIPHGVGGSFRDPKIVTPISATDEYTLMVYDFIGQGPVPQFEIHVSGTTPCNEPPTADANGPYLVAVGGEVDFDGSGSDDPDGDMLSYGWTADGGTLDDNTIESPTFTAGSMPGIYDADLVVNDGTVDSDPGLTTVVVYDPTGGFVTGGGWIDSPPGAYVDDPLLTGKANFGFVSRYRRGATTPTGQTEFHFQVGDLNFHSSSYEWLVVAGHDKAKYKGEGTINGGGNYGFMLTANDNGNSGDTFRIKIWDKDDGDAVVYDNQIAADDNGYSGTLLGGGNIVVHTR